MKTPILETERLILKRGTYDDYVKVYEYDFTKLRNINGQFELVKLDPKKIRGFETYADEEENCLDFIIYLKENMEPIGNIVYDRYIDENKSLEISYNLHPSYWKKGYMTEAIIETMKYIFSSLEIDNIRCGYAEENINSKAIGEKIGFKYSGYHVTHYSAIDKDIKEIETSMSKEDFLNYHENKRIK